MTTTTPDAALPTNILRDRLDAGATAYDLARAAVALARLAAPLARPLGGDFQWPATAEAALGRLDAALDDVHFGRHTGYDRAGLYGSREALGAAGAGMTRNRGRAKAAWAAVRAAALAVQEAEAAADAARRGEYVGGNRYSRPAYESARVAAEEGAAANMIAEGWWSTLWPYLTDWWRRHPEAARAAAA